MSRQVYEIVENKIDKARITEVKRERTKMQREREKEGV